MTADTDDVPPAIEPTVRVVAMPADANADGDIFGGWLVSMMDVAGGTAAARHAHGRVVTIAIDGMTFLRPVSIGDEVSVYAHVAATGRSSMAVAIEAWRRARGEEARYKVTEARFTFVALGPDRRPRAVPPLGEAAA